MDLVHCANTIKSTKWKKLLCILGLTHEVWCWNIYNTIVYKNKKLSELNELNNRGKFSHLHLLSKGKDLSLQVQTVTWGGGKISSAHPYHALECHTQQLVEGLHNVAGKLRNPAVPWRLHRGSPCQGQVEMFNDGFISTAWFPSLPFEMK